MKRWYSLMMALVIVMSLALAGCGGGGNTGANDTMEPYTSEALGVTVGVPSSWVTEEDEAQLTIADSKKSMNADEIVDGAGVVVISMDLADMGGMDDPTEILTIFQESFAAGATTMEVLSEPAARTIQEQPAATTRFKGDIEGQAGIYEVTVIIGQNKLGILLSVDTTEDNAFAATLTKIVDSAKVQ